MNSKHELAEALLRDTREDIGRADAKASMLFGIAGVVLGVLLAGILAGDWSPIKDLRDGEPLWWIGCGCAGAGLASLGFAVYPKIEHPDAHNEKVAYFGHVAEFSNEKDLARAIEKYSEKEGSRTLDQVLHLSKLVIRKYKLIRAALWLFTFGGGLALIGLAIG